MNARALSRVVCAAILAASCASQPQEVLLAPSKPGPKVLRAIALPNAGFEEPMRPGARCAPGWECLMHNDPNSFRFFQEQGGSAGAQSFCIEGAGKEPWGTLDQAMHDIAAVRGAHVRFSASVKLDSVIGQGAGPVIIAQGGSGQTLLAARNLAAGNRGWERVEVELDVPQGTFMLEVGVLLLGRGKVCVDDARLEVLAPASGPV